MLAIAAIGAVGVLWAAAPEPLRFDPPAPRLGDLAIAHVVAEDPVLERGVLRTLGLEFPLFRVSRDAYRGVVAIPTDIPPGPRDVEIVLGSRVLRGVLEVSDRVFDSSELSVSRQFTEKKSKALRARLREETRAMEALFIPEPGPPRFSGRLRRPVEGEITGVFGTRRVFNGKVGSVHYGLDLDARVGTPIRAAQAGVVVMSAMRWASGGTIILDHGSGLFTAYFHMSKRLRAVGERVKAGDLLGAAGRTGRVTGPHLHLAVLVRARNYDPNTGPGATRWFYVDPESFLALDFTAPTDVLPAQGEDRFGGEASAAPP